MDRYLTGRRGEKLVSRLLTKKGYQLVTRNWRCVGGEIDLIFRNFSSYIFVEVKTVKNFDFGYPEERINYFKRVALLRSIKKFSLRHNIPLENCRIDLACYCLNEKRVIYYKNVFELIY
jgi:putative endonuclease